MSGLYYEEFEVGMEFHHSLTRTVTEMDNIMFCALTHNPQPLHLDEEFSKDTEFGQRIVNSLFTLGLVIGVTVGDTTLGTTIANLGMTDVRFANPVFHGDTVRAVTKVQSMRESKSRPNAGMVVFEHYGFNQRDEEVAYCVRTAFMKKKAA
jgi:acyl dehydratase